MVKELRRRPVQGTPDPYLPGHVQVPVRKPVPGMPKVNYSVPDTSFWRVNTRTKKPTSIVTITPDGVNLGWDECGACARSFMHCDCAGGVSLPRSIEHIFLKSGGTKPALPHAVVFQPPVPPRPARGLKKLKRPVNQPKQLLRRKREDVAAKEAETAMEGELKKFRRLKRA